MLVLLHLNNDETRNERHLRLRPTKDYIVASIIIGPTCRLGTVVGNRAISHRDITDSLDWQRLITEIWN